jgi:hypothetical protein
MQKQKEFLEILQRKHHEIKDHEDFPVQVIKDLFMGS